MCRNKKVVGILASILGITLLTSQITHAGQDKSSEDTLDIVMKDGYETVLVKCADYEETSEITGIEWTYLRSDSLTIKEAEGTFSKYLVEDGQTVKQGDALVEYNIPADNVTLEEKQILLKRSENLFKEQKAQKNGMIDIQKQNLSKLDPKSFDAELLDLNIQKLETEYEQYVYQTETSLNAIKDTIKMLQADMETHYVYAPYDGLVKIKFSIEEGAKLDPTTELIGIKDTKSAVLGAETNTYNRLRYNMEVSVTGLNNSRDDKATVYQGKVIAEDSVLDNKAKTGRIYVAFSEPDLMDVFKRAKIKAVTASIQNVLVIPQSVVENDNGSFYVYVLDEDGAIRKQYITGRKNADEMWVYTGLTQGQSIIVE